VVKVKDITGTVERIGLRSTRIRTNEKSLVTVPNKQMVDSVLDNWSSRNLVRNELRTVLPAQFTSAQLEKVIEGIKNILAKEKAIDSYSVHLQEITNDTALIISVYFTALTFPQDSGNQLRERINISIKKCRKSCSNKSSKFLFIEKCFLKSIKDCFLIPVKTILFFPTILSSHVFLRLLYRFLKIL
jgi:MscS family membrane protein